MSLRNNVSSTDWESLLKSYVCKTRNLEKKPGHHKALKKENNVSLLWSTQGIKVDSDWFGELLFKMYRKVMKFWEKDIK